MHRHSPRRTPRGSIDDATPVHAQASACRGLAYRVASMSGLRTCEHPITYSIHIRSRVSGRELGPCMRDRLRSGNQS